MTETAEKKKLWAKIARERRKHTYAVKGLVTDRGIPQSPNEELELISTLLQSNYDLAKMLAKVEPAMQRTAYEQMKPRVTFKPVFEFDQVMKLA